ncbi:MAG: DNA mismatch repair protein MutS [Bacteroidota bacterium]|nr:DNA mismatch repair protein MutS [Bacteroidota bacterium]
MAKKIIIESGIAMTPLMRQYNSIKQQHPDAILFFRIGDFYETFSEDAIVTARVTGITLTKRANGSAQHIELAGFPHHSLDNYLPKLIAAGYRVAICEQLEDPKKTKTIVKRGVTDIITPGTTISEKLLQTDKNNFLACVHPTLNQVGVAFLDLSTGEFYLGQGTKHYVHNLICSLMPSELIVNKSDKIENEYWRQTGTYTYGLEDWIFQKDYTYQKLIDHFKTLNLKGFGVDDLEAGIVAAGTLIYYLKENKHDNLGHVNQIVRLQGDEYVWLDEFTIKNLELLEPNHPQGKSLYDILNFCKSPMGGRMLRKWISLPIKDLDEITRRQNVVSHLIDNDSLIQSLKDSLKQVGDLERLISRISLMRANPREVLALLRALQLADEIKQVILQENEYSIEHLVSDLNPVYELTTAIAATLVDDPPTHISKGETIRPLVHSELDEYRGLLSGGKENLLLILKEEIVKTGISSLKIGYNNVFGYYLEVTNTHKDKVPDSWIRKQTLSNCERYVTEEIKIYEDKIINAEVKIQEIELEIYENLLKKCSNYTQVIQTNAQKLAVIDTLLSFAIAAQKYQYTKPNVNNSLELKLTESRHPVIERNLPSDTPYIDNDILLNNDDDQIIIITGPNMSGKSAILRQVALITLMAHIGSFVPASRADIGLVDKIFTRVGASDNLSIGESTFMVEMTETANILNNLTQRSLIILDEIGRGTATYDGISIAWAITEYLHLHPAQPKTLFATHYHELNEIYEQYPRIKNFHISVKEINEKIIFLRKLAPGGSEHSFGIHVAQLAGVPVSIVDRAKEILIQLERQRNNITGVEGGGQIPIAPIQLKFFDFSDGIAARLKEELLKVDINTTSPIEALMKIKELQMLIKNIE